MLGTWELHVMIAQLVLRIARPCGQDNAGEDGCGVDYHT
jgi:hypothetical protein